MLAAYLATVEVRCGRELPALDYENDVARPFRCDVLRHDLRTIPLALSLPFNLWWKRPRTWLLEWFLRRRLTDLQLVQIRPLWHFLSSELIGREEAEFSSDSPYVTETQLANRRVIEAFEPLASEMAYTVEYEAFDAREWPLARVALASSAFPPFIGPIFLTARFRRVRRSGGSTSESDYLTLSDGGVLSNLGLPARTMSYSQILVSDASYPANLTGPTGVVKFWTRQALSAAMSTYDTRWIRRNRFLGGPPVIRWSIDRSDPRVGDTRLARVRTDLDRFTDAEIKLLENAGYLAANEALSQLDGLNGSIADARPPHPEWLNRSKALWALSGSSHRFLKFRVARRPWDRATDTLAEIIETWKSLRRTGW